MTAGEHDVNILREFIQLFPDLGLSLALKAYLDSELSPFPVKEEENAEENAEEKEDTTGSGKPLDDNMMAPDDKLDAMIVCHTSLLYSILLTELAGWVREDA
jgi:superkiller protein 3